MDIEDFGCVYSDYIRKDMYLFQDSSIPVTLKFRPNNVTGISLVSTGTFVRIYHVALIIFQN